MQYYSINYIGGLIFYSIFTFLLIPLVTIKYLREIRRDINSVKRISPIITPSVKKSILKGRFSFMIFSIVMTAFFVGFIICTIVPYYKDIPFFVSKKYILVEGYVDKIRIDKDWSTTIDINNTKVYFEAFKRPALIMNRKCKVYYLPNTKKVIIVEKLE